MAIYTVKWIINNSKLRERKIEKLKWNKATTSNIKIGITAFINDIKITRYSWLFLFILFWWTWFLSHCSLKWAWILGNLNTLLLDFKRKKQNIIMEMSCYVTFLRVFCVCQYNIAFHTFSGIEILKHYKSQKKKYAENRWNIS